MNVSQSGDRRNELLARPKLARSVRKVIRRHGVPESDVEDLAQDTIERAKKSAHFPEDEASATPYIHRIAANIARDRMKKSGREIPYDHEAIEGMVRAAKAPAFRGA